MKGKKEKKKRLQRRLFIPARISFRFDREIKSFKVILDMYVTI